MHGPWQSFASLLLYRKRAARLRYSIALVSSSSGKPNRRARTRDRQIFSVKSSDAVISMCGSLKEKNGHTKNERQSTFHALIVHQSARLLCTSYKADFNPSGAGEESIELY